MKMGFALYKLEKRVNSVGRYDEYDRGKQIGSFEVQQLKWKIMGHDAVILTICYIIIM